MQKDMHSHISIKKYRDIKRNLQALEQTNYDSIIIIPCSGDSGWHEIAEHSALFYYYEVCQKLNLKNNFFADVTSFYDQYEIGYMRTLSPDSIKTNLKRAGLYQSEETKSYYTIVKLTKSFTKGEIAELKSREHARRLQNLTVEGAINLDPELHQILVSLARRLHKLCNNKLDKLSTITRGAEIVNLADHVLLEYHQITAGARALENLISMRKELYHLIFLIKVMGDVKLWDLEICVSVTEPLVNAKNRVESLIKKQAKKENKKCLNH